MDVMVVVGEETEPRDFDSGTVADVNVLARGGEPLEHGQCQSCENVPTFSIVARSLAKRPSEAGRPGNFFVDMNLCSWLKSCCLRDHALGSIPEPSAFFVIITYCRQITNRT
jgi:hypothetical protein